MSDSGETIILEVDYTAADLQEFYKTHQRRQVKVFRLVVFAVMVAGIIFVFQGLSLLPARRPSAGGNAGNASWMSLIVPIAVFAIMLMAVRIWQKKLYARAFNERNPMQRHHSIELSPTRLITIEPLGRHEFDWNAFNRWVETTNLLLLYVAANNAVLLPKRAFNSPTQLEHCREMLRAKIDTARTAHQAFEVLPAKQDARS